MDASRPAKESAPCVCMVSIIMARAPLPENGFISAVGRAIDPARVEAKTQHGAAHAAHQQVKRAAGAKHRNRHQHGHKIRNDRDGCVKALFRAFDKRLVGIDATPHRHQQKGDDQPEQQHVAEDGRLPRHLRRIQAAKVGTSPPMSAVAPPR